MVTADLVEERQGSDRLTFAEIFRLEWFSGSTYECRAVVCPEQDGGYSAHALRLPGVVSQGDTVDEAMKNLVEAFRGTIQVYRDEEQQIPWQDIGLDRPTGSVERWILVNV